jgi:hypothetical protein
MDNGIIYARDVSNGLITQLKSVDNMLLLYNIVGGCFDGYIAGTNNYAGINSFNVPVAGTYIITVYASAWSSTGSALQINISINGSPTGKSLRRYTNELNSHKTMVPLSFKYNLNQGTNTLTLIVPDGTRADSNDYASFSWIYAPS